jgi:thymidine phosphorylase
MSNSLSPLNTDQNTPLLRLKRVAIDTYRENVAYLHRDCAIYRAEGFQALSKVEIAANGRRILASLNVVDDACIVGVDELGLSEDAFMQLGMEDGHPTHVRQAEPPSSIPALHRKIAGERLNRDDFQAIVRDIAEHRYSKIELTAFVVATNQGELDREEVYYLTDAMASVGRRLDWREHPVVDKHCIGGIPGNRTSMLVVPIVAAQGCCARRRHRVPSHRRRARPTRWKYSPMSSRHSNAYGRLCASIEVAWPGVAPAICLRPMMC